MPPSPERPTPFALAAPATHPDPEDRLRGMLLGRTCSDVRLPLPTDLVSAARTLAQKPRHKVLLPFADRPEEVAMVRDGDDVLVSHYGTGSSPEIHVLDRRVPLAAFLETSKQAVEQVAQKERDPYARQLLLRMSEGLGDVRVRRDTRGQGRTVDRQGGALDAPADGVSLAFGFTARLRASTGASPSKNGSHRADIHALLFHGTLWSFVRGRRITLAQGPIMLPVQRMVAAVRALVDAWDAGRPAHVVLRSGGFHVGTRLDRSGNVSLTLGTREAGSVTAAQLDVSSAALPVLRVASDLLRTLVQADRSQARNLCVRELRDEVRALRRAIRSRESSDGFQNGDPDRLRMSSHDHGQDAEPARPATLMPPPATSLRFAERWRFEIDGLDATATFLCGDRLVMSTPRHTVALCRDTGQLLWVREGTGTTAFMLGKVLGLVSTSGQVDLCDVEDGETYASTRVAPRMGGTGLGLYVGGGSTPPMAVMNDGHRHLVAIDLRTGQQRWRFSARGQGPIRVERAGRVLVVTSGGSAVHALDAATGEVAWRFSAGARFSLPALAHGDVAVVAAGEPGGRSGTAFGLDLFRGELLWKRPLEAAPNTAPVAAGPLVGLSFGVSQPTLAALCPKKGTLRWMVPDPGLGGASMSLDRTLVVNGPAGKLSAVDLATGATLWSQSLSHPVADEIPRRLEPILRGGALFVPAASVHVVRPHDGQHLGTLPSELVPDVVRVDERGWVYVAEESGHVAAYGPVAQLRLIPGGLNA